MDYHYHARETARGREQLMKKVLDDQLHQPVDAAQATQLDLVERAVQLGPAEDLLHQLALLLTQPEAVARALGLGQQVLVHLGFGAYSATCGTTCRVRICSRNDSC